MIECGLFELMSLSLIRSAASQCPDGGLIELDGGGEAVDADLGDQPTPTGPVDDILSALGSPTGAPTGGGETDADGPSDPLRRFLGTFLGVG